jgi:hypothetical protein
MQHQFGTVVMRARCAKTPKLNAAAPEADTLLEFKRGMQREDVHASTVILAESKPSKLKRYFNE